MAKNQPSHESDSDAPKDRDSPAYKDRATLVIAIFGAVLGVINSAVAISSYRNTAQVAARTSRLEAERDIDAAWDLLAGAEPGSGATNIYSQRFFADTHPTLVYLNATQQQREKARRLLRDVLIRDPENSRAKEVLALYSEASSDWVQAVDLRRQLLNREPNDPQRLYSLGLTLYSAGEWREAIPYLERAVSLKDDPDFVAMLSNALFEKSRSPEVRDDERSAVSVRVKQLTQIQRRLRATAATTAGAPTTNPDELCHVTRWRLISEAREKYVEGQVVNMRDCEAQPAIVAFYTYNGTNQFRGEITGHVDSISPHGVANFRVKVPDETAKLFLSGTGGGGCP